VRLCKRCRRPQAARRVRAGQLLADKQLGLPPARGPAGDRRGRRRHQAVQRQHRRAQADQLQPQVWRRARLLHPPRAGGHLRVEQGAARRLWCPDSRSAAGNSGSRAHALCAERPRRAHCEAPPAAARVCPSAAVGSGEPGRRRRCPPEARRTPERCTVCAAVRRTGARTAPAARPTPAARAQGADHSLRYLSLHDNRFLRYFQGHTARVTSLCMSPRDDTFISAAQARPAARRVPCVSAHARRHVATMQYAFLSSRRRGTPGRQSLAPQPGARRRLPRRGPLRMRTHKLTAVTVFVVGGRRAGQHGADLEPEHDRVPGPAERRGRARRAALRAGLHALRHHRLPGAPAAPPHRARPVCERGASMAVRLRAPALQVEPVEPVSWACPVRAEGS
jgi:hypothetical protein